MRGLRLAALGTVLLAWPLAAHADVSQCADDADRAQTALQGGHPLEAAAAAKACAVRGCPDVIRRDCERWVQKAHHDSASLVVRVIDESAIERHGARVTVDGPGGTRSAAAGLAAELDPGSYRVQAQLDTLRGDAEVTLGPGEKERELVIVLRRAPRSAAPSWQPSPARWPWPWVAGGVAVVGAVGFGALQWSAKSSFDDLAERCGREGSGLGCARSDIDSIHRRVTASGVLLGVGVIAAATAAVLFVLEPKATSTSPRALRLRASGAELIF